MKEIKQLSIFVENKVGRMSEITQIMAKNGIDIRALSIADTTDYGIFRLIVNDPDKAMKVLQEGGMMVTLTSVIGIEIPDVSGALHSVVAILSDAGISIEYMYAFLNPDTDAACVILRVENNEEAIKILGEKNVKILDSTVF